MVEPDIIPSLINAIKSLFFELADEDQQSVVGGANTVSAFVTGAAPEDRGDIGIGNYPKSGTFQFILSFQIAAVKASGFPLP